MPVCTNVEASSGVSGLTVVFANRNEMIPASPKSKPMVINIPQINHLTASNPCDTGKIFAITNIKKAAIATCTTGIIFSSKGCCIFSPI